MKIIKAVAIIMAAIITSGLISCKKSTQTTTTDLTSGITGTYKGTLTQGSSKSSLSQATTVVSRINDYTVKIHCTGTGLDTTCNLLIYEYGNLYMVCTTGNDFYYEYGHHESGDHHMMSDDGHWTTFEQHMSKDHQPGDKHYGEFNMTDHLFEYTFRIQNESSNYSLKFSGNKQ